MNTFLHPHRAWRLLRIAALAATALLAFSRSPVHAAGGPVDTTVYVCDANHLQSAIRGAGGGGTVTFACSGTIVLTATITLNKNLTIDGSGQSVTISGGNNVAVFTVNPGVTVTLNDLTIAKGFSAHSGGIDNSGALAITNSTFTGNHTAGDGGGIYNEGTLTITNSTFSNNSAYDGGGIYNEGTLTITNSTFSDNSAYGGGAIDNEGGTVNVANTILANSTRGPNCSGAITDLSGNLDSGASCVSNNPRSDSLTDTDPQLMPLADNGGPTQTMALESTSPAIDLGVQPYCTDAQPQGAGGVDQRGYPRDTTGSNPTCDAGAYEYGG